MRRGCIAISEVLCSDCGRIIRYGERYLAYDVDGGIRRLCLDCCTKKGFVAYKRERGQEILTLLGEGAETSTTTTTAQTEAKPKKERKRRTKSKESEAVPPTETQEEH